MKIYVSLFIIIFTVAAFAQKNKNLGPYYSEKDEKEILKVMDDQAKAWNEGSIEGYMKGYWNSDSLRFVAGPGIQYGWKLTLDMYKRNFKSKEDMGTLRLKAEALDFLNKNVAFMIGKWEVDAKNKIGGHFTQIWKKIKGKWLITVDHTSR